ncbi:MAG: TetR/AcrR family transcriptional regulator [Woeseiaceae bacterium]|nr:TetR/AcrR family transcriptional regulator [Woeseiaceae bacterium]
MTTVRRKRKGRETRAAILAAATDVLLREGYGNFVFRRVAKRAGVEPGNVQYYFPTKRDLLSAVLQPELENYLDRLQRELDKGQTEAEKIDRMVRYLMTDILNERTLKLWLSIYGMAAHDEEMAEMVSEWYRSYIDSLAGYLQNVYPDLDRDRAYDAATCVTAQFDGLMVVLQIGKPKRQSIARIRRSIDAIVTRVIDAHSGGS